MSVLESAPLTWMIPIALAAALTLTLAFAARRGLRVLVTTIAVLVAALLCARWQLGPGVALENVRCGPRCGHGASLRFVWIAVAIAAIGLALWLGRSVRLPVRSFVAFGLGLIVLGLTLDVWVA